MPGNVRIRLGLPMKKPLQGAVMIAIASAFCSTPAFCIEEIEEWQKYIKQEQAGGPQFAENVAGATICLANQFQRYGMIKQADETFEKAIGLYRNLAVVPEKQQFVGLYTSWARTLLKGRLPSRSRDKRELRYQATETSKEDFPRIDCVLRKAWTILTSSEEPTKMRSFHFVDIVQMFHETGNSKEVEKCERYLLQICASIERSKVLNIEEVKWTKEVLNGLCYAIYPESRTIPRRSEIEAVVNEMKTKPSAPIPDTSKLIPINSNSFWKLSDDQKAEVLRLTALALVDKCESNENERLEAHRNMALWYISAGKFQKAVAETMRLSDIMGVREAFLLFPIPQQCQGRCGMG